MGAPVGFRPNVSVLSVSVFLLTLVSCSEENLQIEQMKISKARNQAEILSYEALVINAPAAMVASKNSQRKNQQNNSRGPASENDSNSVSSISGTMGKDPWGQAFRYMRVTEVTKDSEKAQTHVVVWSAGPNRQFEFNPEAPGQSPGDDIIVRQSH